MSQKRIQQIEQRIDRIKRTLVEIGPMRPGSLTRQYKDPQHRTGAYWQNQLHPSDEEPHGVRPTGMREGASSTDRNPQAVQTPG